MDPLLHMRSGGNSGDLNPWEFPHTASNSASFRLDRLSRGDPDYATSPGVPGIRCALCADMCPVNCGRVGDFQGTRARTLRGGFVIPCPSCPK
jgi:formate hydrogenlyase subunit 6/NADH:ubiquinone oxidoreductase subunit I